MRQYLRLLSPLAVVLVLAGCGSTESTSPAPAPVLQVSATNLDFGAQLVNTASAVQVVTIRNTGTEVLTGFTGGTPNDGQFTLVSTCTTLAPGDSCTYTFQYRPAINGADTARSTTTTNAGSFDITLTGAGVGSPLWVTPLVLDFGPLGVGQTSTTQTVTITNAGTSTLTNFGGGNVNPPFSVTQNCAGGVAPGASCQYFFTFTPTNTGNFTTSSITTTNAGPFFVTLTGRGVGAGLSVTPLALDFGPVSVGATSATQSVTVTNTGQSTLTNFAGGNVNPPFSVTQDCAGGVAPGASCRYFFTFTPTAVGSFTATSTSSTNAGPIQVTLSGTGVSGPPPAGPGLSVTPLVLDFGPVGVGRTSAMQSVTITNTGQSTLTNFAGGNVNPPFSATQNCAGGVAPGASCEFFYTFAPTAVGEFGASPSGNTNAGAFAVLLQGTGVAGQPWVSPLELNFGTVKVGMTSAPLSVTLTNVGLGMLGGFAGGGVSPPFSNTQNCAGGVAPGATCQFVFTFTPTAEGYFTATSNVSTDGGSFTITMEGAAMP